MILILMVYHKEISLALKIF